MAHQQIIGTGFAGPEGVFPDPAGNVWVADTGNNRIVKIAPDGTQTTVTIDPTQITGPLDGPADVVLDAAGDLYISDTNNYRALYVSADQSVQAVIYQQAGAPNGAFGGIWIDPVGQLYITDALQNRIVQIQDLVSSLNFGPTRVGVSSAPQVIQVSNIGNLPLNVEGLTFPTDFQQQGVSTDALVPDCSASSATLLNSGKSCFIGVTFKPTKVGSLNESLGITNTDFNADTAPYFTDSYPLSGTGTATAAVAAPKPHAQPVKPRGSK